MLAPTAADLPDLLHSVQNLMTRVDVHGTSLEYVERGSGEPVVFVHGSASDGRTWQLQQEELGRGYRTIVYSRRFHWPNETIAEGADYSMPEHVDDLRALLRSLDAAPAHLVGHSYGAYVCLLLAISEPGLVRTLVLTEPPVLPLVASVPPTSLEIVRLMMTRPRTGLAAVMFAVTGLGPATAAVKRGDTEAAIRIFGHAVLGRRFYRRLAKSRLQQVRDNFIAAEFLGSGLAPLDARKVRGLRVPTLLVTGEHSPALFHRLTDRLYELLPGAERIEIPGASHLMHEDNAQAYSAALISHLRRHSGPRPGPV
jgi:pimeloyl-ACP methyl ester carboxylesterase